MIEYVASEKSPVALFSGCSFRKDRMPIELNPSARTSKPSPVENLFIWWSFERFICVALFHRATTDDRKWNERSGAGFFARPKRQRPVMHRSRCHRKSG